MCRNVGFNEEFAWLHRISDIDKNAETKRAQETHFAKGNASRNDWHNCTMEIIKHCEIM